MTTTAEQATAAPTSVKLCGESYRIRPLNEQDFSEFVLHCQSIKTNLARRSAGELDDPEMAKAILAHAQTEASALTMTHPFVLAQMLDIGGVALLIWLSLRDFCPGLQYVRPDDESHTVLKEAAAVRAMLLDPVTLDDATAVYEQLNSGYTEVEAEKGPSPAHPQGGRRRRRRRRKAARQGKKM